ncbi:BRCT domain-containing protein [Serendipita vermifera]|nr:BRCT domain-containing protein [Serendipita vermifera]
MEKFLKITKSKPNGRVPREKDDHKNRFHPYSERVAAAQLARQEWFEMGQEKRKTGSSETGETTPRPANSIQAAKKHALSTLSHPGNPLTNPDALRQPDHVWSCATGHQRGDGRRIGSSLIIKRNEQLEVRRETHGSSLFWGCRIYCNSGYCAGTTDIELKRLVSEYGGVVAHTETQATHILTSQSLCGSKLQKFLTTNARNKKHVVKPEWLLDSIALGKRKQEREYTVIQSVNQGSLQQVMSVKSATASKTE